MTPRIPERSPRIPDPAVGDFSPAERLVPSGVRDRTTRPCAQALTSPGQMFPGTCAASATLTELEDCAAGLAHGQFYQSAATFVTAPPRATSRCSAAG